MMRILLKSKIHRAKVTDTNLDYIGSITICRNLMKMADIWPWEKVLVADITNGNRAETYAIPGPEGCICINGAAAHRIHKGDLVIIMSFVVTKEPIEPKIVLVDDNNRFVKYIF